MINLSTLISNDIDYIDTDVLVHSLVNQNFNLHLKVIDMIDEINSGNRFLISWLSIQEMGFVLAKLNQPTAFITSKLDALNIIPACWVWQF